MEKYIQFTAEDILKIYIDDFYAVEGFDQEARLYTYSKSSCKLVRLALQHLDIHFDITERNNAYILIVDADELKLKCPNITFNNTIENEF